jgi:hypothetical protein
MSRIENVEKISKSFKKIGIGCEFGYSNSIDKLEAVNQIVDIEKNQLIDAVLSIIQDENPNKEARIKQL